MAPHCVRLLSVSLLCTRSCASTEKAELEEKTAREERLVIWTWTAPITPRSIRRMCISTLLRSVSVSFGRPSLHPGFVVCRFLRLIGRHARLQALPVSTNVVDVSRPGQCRIFVFECDDSAGKPRYLFVSRANTCNCCQHLDEKRRVVW
jgi:hypothetical protein